MAEETKKPQEKETMKEKPTEKAPEKKESQKKDTQPDVKPSEAALTKSERRGPAELASAKSDTPKSDSKTESTEATEKKETPKAKEDSVSATKKEVAVAKGKSYPISRKHSQFICAFIKHKTIEQALQDLNSVIAMKQAVPFKGEIPHRKGPMMSGRYPVKAAEYFINLVKALRGNILVNQMDLEKSKISLATSSWARRPARRGNRRGKRTHVTLEAREVKRKTDKKKEANSKDKGEKK